MTVKKCSLHKIWFAKKPFSVIEALKSCFTDERKNKQHKNYALVEFNVRTVYPSMEPLRHLCSCRFKEWSSFTEPSCYSIYCCCTLWFSLRPGAALVTWRLVTSFAYDSLKLVTGPFLLLYVSALFRLYYVL